MQDNTVSLWHYVGKYGTGSRKEIRETVEYFKLLLISLLKIKISGMG